MEWIFLELLTALLLAILIVCLADAATVHLQRDCGRHDVTERLNASTRY